MWLFTIIFIKNTKIPMLKLLFFLSFALFAITGNAQTAMREGDILFQTSDSPQAEAIGLATHSQYSHCGILLKENNEWVVLEAVQPVKTTPLKAWIAHGKSHKYAVRRLKNVEMVLKPNIITLIHNDAKKYIAKDYDIYFGWADDRIYCSELVWKIYKAATALEIGKLQTLREMDLKSPLVQKQLAARYGSKIPYDEPVISPQAVYESALLETINY
jgi:hypothetical protein